MGKFVLEAKFWVTAMVVSRLSTTCHIPPGTNTVSPVGENTIVRKI